MALSSAVTCFELYKSCTFWKQTTQATSTPLYWPSTTKYQEVPTSTTLYWPSTIIYQPGPPCTDPLPPSTNLYCHILTQYHQVPTSAAFSWPSTILYQPVPLPTDQTQYQQVLISTALYWSSTTKYQPYWPSTIKYHTQMSDLPLWNISYYIIYIYFHGDALHLKFVHPLASSLLYLSLCWYDTEVLRWSTQRIHG